MDHKNDQNIKTELELLDMLAQSDEDVRNGRMTPLKDTFDSLRKELEGGKN